MWGYSLWPSLSSCDVWTPSNLLGSPHSAGAGQDLDLWNELNTVYYFFRACFSVCVCVCAQICFLRLTWQGATEKLQPHAQRAIPVLRDDSDVTGHHGLSQLVHHRSICVTVSKKQLDYRERDRSQGKSGIMFTKWHLRGAHPVCISIMDGGPFSAIIAESQVVGRNKVTPGSRQHIGSMWVCGIFFLECTSFIPAFQLLHLTRSRSPVLELWPPWTLSRAERLTQTSGPYPLSLHTTLHLSYHLHQLSPENNKHHGTGFWVLQHTSLLVCFLINCRKGWPN